MPQFLGFAKEPFTSGCMPYGQTKNKNKIILI